jgi:hypothetical protein
MDLVNRLKDTDLKDFIDKYFNGSITSFFDFLTKKGIFDDMSEHLMSNDYGTDVLAYYYEKNPQKTLDLITNEYFHDVEKDGERYWLTINREDLSDIFETNRWGGGVSSLAKNVLSDDIHDFFDYVQYYDLYEDVISDLNEKNIQTLKEKVYNEIKDSNLEFEDEILDTREKVMSLTDVEISKLIEGEGLNIISDLSNLYNSSYEYAYYDESYDLVMGELKGLFGLENFSREKLSKRKVLDKETKKIKDIDTTQYQVDITNLLSSVVSTVISYGGYNSDNDFEYYGSFEGVLRFMMGEEDSYLSFRIPDYPDFSLVKKNLNELFNDYI